MNNYKSTIGLEIHTELKTKTKMFCGCLNDFNEKHPNINICPICMGHPGTLPTINKKAVESVLKLGLALNSEIPKLSKFDRKNYFYPDLPKGYQISQYDKPLIIGGRLNNIKITRIHLEEDTARLLHATNNQQLITNNYSLVDFNRTGIPLMELVTEPDIKTGEEAVGFAKELQLILRYLDISDADMEKGQMRVEANISLRITDHRLQQNKEAVDRSLSTVVILGTKVEIKNLNSFRAVQEAIDYEIKRQTEILEKGEKVLHETRGWDEIKKKTEHQRLKEESHDYRYFPEPDLPILDLADFNLEKLKVEIPELPSQKRERFVKEFALKPEQAKILAEDRAFAEYFEESASELLEEIPDGDRDKNIQLLYNYFSSDFKGLMNEKGIAIIKEINPVRSQTPVASANAQAHRTSNGINITPENFADLIVLMIKNEISSRSAKDIIREMAETGLDPRQIIKEKGLTKISDNDILKKTIDEVVSENLGAVEDYKKGQENAIQFLIGQAMKKIKGRGNPETLKELFKKQLKL